MERVPSALIARDSHNAILVDACRTPPFSASDSESDAVCEEESRCQEGDTRTWEAGVFFQCRRCQVFLRPEGRTIYLGHDQAFCSRICRNGQIPRQPTPLRVFPFFQSWLFACLGWMHRHNLALSSVSALFLCLKCALLASRSSHVCILLAWPIRHVTRASQSIRHVLAVHS